MKYSGSVSFEFYIERYKNKISNELKTLDKVHPEDEYLYDYEEITLYVKGSSFFTPGKFYGVPENCYPDEGNTEIQSVIGPFEEDWEDKLTAEERERIICMIVEQVQEQDPSYDEDGDDEDSCFFSEEYL